jgi:hypothetical protein
VIPRARYSSLVLAGLIPVTVNNKKQEEIAEEKRKAEMQKNCCGCSNKHLQQHNTISFAHGQVLNTVHYQLRTVKYSTAALAHNLPEFD